VTADPLVEQVLDAAARDDRAALVQLLHPYLRWIRDGRIYRWIER
jgi:hypothetical protein